MAQSSITPNICVKKLGFGTHDQQGNRYLAYQTIAGFPRFSLYHLSLPNRFSYSITQEPICDPLSTSCTLASGTSQHSHFYFRVSIHVPKASAVRNIVYVWHLPQIQYCYLIRIICKLLSSGGCTSNGRHACESKCPRIGGASTVMCPVNFPAPCFIRPLRCLGKCGSYRIHNIMYLLSIICKRLLYRVLHLMGGMLVRAGLFVLVQSASHSNDLKLDDRFFRLPHTLGKFDARQSVSQTIICP